MAKARLFYCMRLTERARTLLGFKLLMSAAASRLYAAGN